ncbi:MAG: rhodanese-like domain-containing protein [Gemmatimonadota bacterium]
MRQIRLLVGALLAGVAAAGAQLPTGEQLLVTSAWLSAHLNDRDLVLLHVGRPEEYATAHIAGARFAEQRDFASDEMPMLEMLPEAQLRQNLERNGIGDQTRVVVVFGPGSVDNATRLYFTLGYAGLGTRALFLDGGLAAWQRAGNPVTAVVPPAPTAAHYTGKMLPAAVVNSQQVVALQHAVQPRLIDARASVYFSGPKTAMMAQGHIPGAINIPYSSLVDDAEQLLPRAALLEKFTAAGVRPGDSLVVYCHIGQQATVVLLAARVLGHPVQLYDGSFHDWSNRKLPTDNASASAKRAP